MADATRLIACLADVERHVSSAGWDQPARLFALVSTAQLLALEPQLRGRVPEANDDALTAIEQDDFHATDNVFERLSGIYWPDTVEGVALAMERSFLPPQFEGDLPEDGDAAERFVSSHPEKQDVRVVVGVLRDGSRHGLARLISNPEDLLGSEDLVPGLAEALLATLEGESS
ncbi:PPA1309 family protein [Tessaracoccus caeni]|uniref:PPA1309 family protein n=1 Tax=Tessaracoccus caeni TaxID=3031239 RepID=UPI0023DA2492|nr:PPA1309 family protein [Tessaracoccus caeni]MDF1486786.1 PPA1309 family protein [Tessaracoccus caeni]